MDNATSVQVRVGTPEDVHAMVDIAMMAARENGIVSPDPIMLLQDLWPALNKDRGIVGIIGAPGKQIEAAVLLRIGHTWYNGGEDLLEERAIFVHPEYRSAKGGRAARLCEFSKSVSDTLNIPLTIGILSSQRTEAKIRMYRRILGEPSGAYWLYNAKTGDHSPTLSAVGHE